MGTARVLALSMKSIKLKEIMLSDDDLYYDISDDYFFEGKFVAQ